MTTAYPTCPLCEATCGLALTVEGGRVTAVRGDAEHVFSKGFLCPKGAALPDLHADPDRLRTPLVRRDGELRPATWDEALATVERALQVHPEDAATLGLSDGGRARVTSEAGELLVEVQITDVVRPGVVSLPHGWGHGRPGTQLGVAARFAGVNANRLVDPTVLDPLSGNAVQNDVPVRVRPV